MSYIVTVSNRTYPVLVEPEGLVRVDGSSLSAQVRQLDRCTFSVLLNNRSYKVIAEKLGNVYETLVNGVAQEVIVETERTRLLKKYDRQAGAIRKRFEVHAPMPALIVNIEVDVGDDVTEGQGLIVLEAMKMENEIKAHQPGKVKTIHVVKGKPVEKGELLMLLE
ncbi:MAG: hypothetical protein HY708_00680 [Ignavibacteriae bacterium]|nr:hypothetical protein [Ignavibacteriota bacterium]